MNGKDPPDPNSNQNKQQPTINPNADMNDDVDDNSEDIEHFSNANKEIQESSSTATESQRQKSKIDTASVSEGTVFGSSNASNQENQPLEINVGGSFLSTLSSSTVSPYLKHRSLTSSFCEQFESTRDTQKQAIKMIEAMEETEEKRKL